MQPVCRTWGNTTSMKSWITWIFPKPSTLIHWGWMTHICVDKLTTIGSDNGLSPGRGQAIIWTNAGILLIGPLGANFNEILIGIQTFSFKKMYLKTSSANWIPFCVGLSVLSHNWKYSKTVFTYKCDGGTGNISKKTRSGSVLLMPRPLCHHHWQPWY